MKINMFKKIVTILCCFLIIFSLCYTLFFNVLAAGSVTSYSGTIDGVSDAAGMSKKIIGTILSVIRTVAAAIAIIVLVVIACKYMIASAGDRADIKKYAVNYIIGAVILFSASAIIGIIKDAVDDSLGG